MIAIFGLRPTPRWYTPWQGWPPAPARRAVGDGRPTNSRITPGCAVMSGRRRAVDRAVEDVGHRRDAGLVVDVPRVARQLHVTELVEHRYDRDREQMGVVVGAIALGLSTFDHVGDERDRDRAQ